jgi:hypothetical protein
VRDDVKILREGVQIVVGTPGRVYGTNDEHDTACPPIGGVMPTKRSRSTSLQRRMHCPLTSLLFLRPCSFVQI